MIDIGVRVEKISLDIKTPTDKRFWATVGGQVVKEIQKATYAGKDVDGVGFTAYSKAYAKAKAEGNVWKSKGRKYPSRGYHRPDLTLSGRMIKSIPRGIRPYGGVLTTKAGVKIIMDGEEGAKAHGNEANGRVFFDVSKVNTIKILKSVDAYLVKQNGLK